MFDSWSISVLSTSNSMLGDWRRVLRKCHDARFDGSGVGLLHASFCVILEPACLIFPRPLRGSVDRELVISNMVLQRMMGNYGCLGSITTVFVLVI